MSLACLKRVKPSINLTSDPPMSTPRFWLVIPAAGVGARMQADRPKQYLQLAGRCIIEHSLDCFLEHPDLMGVVVCLAPNDPYWPTLAVPAIRALSAPMAVARTRRFGVAGFAAPERIGAKDQDWVLVHDAARPNLSRAAILICLLSELADDPVGGLLAVPARDTLKRASADGRVAATIDRSHDLAGLIRRRCSVSVALQRALADALGCRRGVTDEASALEWAGQAPRLIEGRADNLKITRPEDLEWLRQRWLAQP